MRAHMQAICKQCHGAVGKPRHDLDDHHRRGDDNYPKGTALTRPDLVLAEDMFVLPLICGFGVHFVSHRARKPDKHATSKAILTARAGEGLILFRSACFTRAPDCAGMAIARACNRLVGRPITPPIQGIFINPLHPPICIAVWLFCGWARIIRPLFSSARFQGA